MQVRADKLEQTLARTALPAWLVAGDEPFQIGECCDQIRKHAQANDFADRQLFSADTGIDWHAILNAAQSMGLFGGKTLIEIRLGEKRPDKTGSEILQQLLNAPNPDVMLLISASKLDRRKDMGSKWVTALDQVGALVEVWPVTAHQLPQWINTRLQRQHLDATPEAVALLAERSEGNLLACAQEIDKLSLLFSGEQITPQAVQEAVGNASRYTAFDLTDALDNAERALRILDGLREEGSEPPVILWALTREIRMMEAFASGNRQGIRLPPQKIASLERQALKLGLPSLGQALSLSARIDQSIKGMRPGDPWQGLAALVLRLCGQPLPAPLEQL